MKVFLLQEARIESNIQLLQKEKTDSRKRVAKENNLNWDQNKVAK